jgi:hypothetical protein
MEYDSQLTDKVRPTISPQKSGDKFCSFSLAKANGYDFRYEEKNG